MSLTKTGDGRLRIAGTASYGGDTTVSRGRLETNGRLTASVRPVTVSAGAVLGGTGSIERPGVQYGTISPGNSAGTLTISSLDARNGAVFENES